MTSTTTSKSGRNIRLTAERWAHITEEHAELTGMLSEVMEVITAPDSILAGNDGELLAVKELMSGKYLVVVYRESDRDGFVITAFLTRRKNSLDRRIRIWP
jgi:hypothetical protein